MPRDKGVGGWGQGRGRTDAEAGGEQGPRQMLQMLSRHIQASCLTHGRLAYNLLSVTKALALYVSGSHCNRGALLPPHLQTTGMLFAAAV